MDMNYTCPDCRDSGWIFRRDSQGNEFASACKCQAIKKAMARLQKSGLAKEFQTKNFDNYCTHGNSTLEDAKNTAIDFVERFEDQKDTRLNSLLLCGQVGAGKTHLGTASAVQLIDQGIELVYMGYREEMTSLKAHVTDADVYEKEINHFKKAQVLFIDDFLKGKITEADINIIYEIVNYRYNNNMPMILSTEKTLDGLINFDEAIGSRLIEMCRGHIIEFCGKELNYRLYGGAA